MKQWQWEAVDEPATDRLAQALAATAPPRAVVSLQGTLGAGKTRLVRGIAAAAGIDPAAVVSPTFVLLQSYRGRPSLHHFDAYRLADEDEFLALGADEYIESEGLTLIEWGERVEACLPRDRLEIEIQVQAAEQRLFQFRAGGPTAEQWLAQVRQWLADRRPSSQPPSDEHESSD